MYGITPLENYRFSARVFVDNRSIICIETYTLYIQ